MHVPTRTRRQQMLFFTGRIVALVGCVLTAQGCGDLLKQPYPAKSYFGIETGAADAAGPTTADAVASIPPQTGPVMLVRAVRVSPPFDGLAFVYQVGPSQFTTDYYVNWIASPSALLTGDLTNWLSAAGVGSVVAPNSTLRPNLILETEVTRLVIDRTEPGNPRAVIAARFFLARADSASASLIFQHAGSAEVSATRDAPDGYAAAFGEAYRKLLEDLTTDLRATFSKK